MSFDTHMLILTKNDEVP